jgi:uncharacterized protein (DUF2147 family)
MLRISSYLYRKAENAWNSILLFFTFCVCFVLTFIPEMLCGQVIGLWKTIDDLQGNEIAIIQIYERDNRLYGKVLRLLPAAKRTTCEGCSGSLKNRPITGMDIIQSLTITSNGGEKGKVLDPGSGRTYSCFIELVSHDKLKLRGYVGIPSIGRTQYWYRVSG